MGTSAHLELDMRLFLAFTLLVAPIPAFACAMRYAPPVEAIAQAPVPAPTVEAPAPPAPATNLDRLMQLVDAVRVAPVAPTTIPEVAPVPAS